MNLHFERERSIGCKHTYSMDKERMHQPWPQSLLYVAGAIQNSIFQVSPSLGLTYTITAHKKQ
jgi:hypothetical protein